jgi:glucose/arabinose dehydrogenase
MERTKIVNRLLACVCILLAASSACAGDKLPKPFVTGLKNPESAAVGLDGRIYVTEIGEFGKDGDGRVLVIDKDGKAVPFATGLDDPKGMVSFQTSLFVADNKRVVKIDKTGKVTVLADEKAFPTPPMFLNDITADPEVGFDSESKQLFHLLYVSDSGDLKGAGGAVYRIKVFPGNPKLKQAEKVIVTTLTDGVKNPLLKTPNGLVMDGKNHVLMLDFTSGDLLRIRVSDAKTEKIADGFDGGDGLAWDQWGRLYVSSWKTGKMWVIPRAGQQPVLMAEGFQSAADICLDPTGKFIIVPDMKAGTLTKLPIGVPSQPIDDSPLPIKAEVAFPKLQWAGWKGEKEDGKTYELRPLVLTHAGDGSNRNFVAIQQGTIHVFPNDQAATQTKLFLNIETKVHYNDKENEQGLLGLAFHPKFKTNGEFFVFYTTKKKDTKSKEPPANVVSRFKVSKDDPDKADPNSEEVLLTIKRPFWNHDGGTLCFGPDGYLYIALGDGGAGDDPFKNGQNLNTLLAKVLRIDVDGKAEGKAYGIPKDNPFVGMKDARPEIWAYGLRNIWRMSFDRKTGKLWASDVGQNLYEEIDIIEKGGNYGWSIREGLHPFSLAGVGPRKDLIEPIWEYRHDVGKSLTGGHVYRGKRLPELDGYYLYGDYVTTKIWGLRYDDTQKRVVANRPIADTNAAILSFGEDEQGDVYLLTTSISGKSVLRFVQK